MKSVAVSAILHAMSYRRGRLSREARNQRRRLRRLDGITPAMRRVLIQILEGAPVPAARPHTIHALVRREILSPSDEGYALTPRGTFVALVAA